MSGLLVVRQPRGDSALSAPSTVPHIFHCHLFFTSPGLLNEEGYASPGSG